MKFASKLSKETLVCSELRVKEYKNLLKCTYGDNPDELIFIETLCELLSVVTNKPVDYLKKLNIVDLFCLILDVRINSLGNICKIIITRDHKKMNLELKLDYIKKEIEDVFASLSSTIEFDNIKIAIECPSVDKLLQQYEEQYLSFIKNISIKQENKSFNISTKDQASLLLERISPKLYLEIIKASNKVVKTIHGLNFLSRYKIKSPILSFDLSIESLLWFVKLMFNESLESFYDNLFYLSHMSHMNAEYIEQSAVGEYNYFVTCLKRTLAPKDSASESQTISNEDSALLH